MSEKKVHISLILPVELNERFKVLAAESYRTKSAYIRQVLRRYLQYLDHLETGDEAEIDWRI